MNISAEDSIKYPYLAAVIKTLFFTVAKRPKLKAALERYAGDPYALAILYPQGPRVRVDADFFLCLDDDAPERQPDGSRIQKYTMKYGFTVPSTKSNEIYVAPDLARNAGAATGRELLEATLLHECVHWYRMIDDKDVYSEVETYAFEKEAYGRIMGRSYEICPPKRL
jgi:Metallopeptidase toxin 3